MPRGRLLELEVETRNVKARLLELEVATEVIPPVRARLLDLAVTTLLTPRRRLLDLEVTTVITLTGNAGPDQTVQSGQRVHLSGLASGGWPTGYHWEQASGPLVQLEPSADIPTPSFLAPALDETTVFAFELTVSDGDNIDTTPDPVQITVLPHIDWIFHDDDWLPYIDEIFTGVT